ncbi:MAG: hypothetical protein ACFFD1_04580 [Candidatus Thorarchaeota archaeon]
MHKNTWKEGERRIARMFNTVRTPLSGGRSRHTMSDSLSENIFLEIKHRKKIPGDTLWQETKRCSKKEQKIPAIIFLKYQHPDPVIMCNLSDIKKIAAEMKDENKIM